MLYKPCKALLSFYFQERSFSKIIETSRLNQIGHILSSWTKNALALLLAVHLAAIPLSLYFFGKFPLLSLVYNLFFPLLVSASLFLFIIGAAFFLIIPQVGAYVLHLCSEYTHFILSLVVHLPRSFDWVVRTGPFPKQMIIGYFVMLFSAGILYSIHGERKQLLEPNF